MNFEADIRRFALKLEGRVKEVVTLGGVEVQRSVVEGSELTGAPGQPVDTGNLKASFIPERVSDTEWQTTTNVSYAPAIEAGIGLNLRSTVGGFHSVALTRGGWQNIIDHVVPQVVGE